MSRTYRRKNEQWDYEFLFKNDLWDEEERRWYIRDYHRDDGDRYCLIPAWFRRDLNRQRRAKHKQELIKCLKSDDYEYVPIMRYPRDAMWNWT